MTEASQQFKEEPAAAARQVNALESSTRGNTAALRDICKEAIEEEDEPSFRQGDDETYEEIELNSTISRKLRLMEHDPKETQLESNEASDDVDLLEQNILR